MKPDISLYCDKCFIAASHICRSNDLAMSPGAGVEASIESY